MKNINFSEIVSKQNFPTRSLLRDPDPQSKKMDFDSNNKIIIEEKYHVQKHNNYV